jgi:hypothetical protein
MKADWTFLKQALRWTRNSWRSDLRSVFVERHIWKTHPYGSFPSPLPFFRSPNHLFLLFSLLSILIVCYSMIDKFFNPLTLLAGPVLIIYLCVRSSTGQALPTILGGYFLPAWNILISYFVWLTLTRTLKLLPHLVKRPKDVLFIPAWIAFGFFFSVLKLYALFTLHEVRSSFRVRRVVADAVLLQVGWGTRAGIDPLPPTTSCSPSDKPSSSPSTVSRTSSRRTIRFASPPPSSRQPSQSDPSSLPILPALSIISGLTSYRLSVSDDPFEDATRAVNEEWRGYGDDGGREEDFEVEEGLTPTIRAVEKAERGVY